MYYLIEHKITETFETKKEAFKALSQAENIGGYFDTEVSYYITNEKGEKIKETK